MTDGANSLIKENITNTDSYRNGHLLIPRDNHKKRFNFIEKIKSNTANTFNNPRLHYGTALQSLFFHIDSTNKNGRKRQRKTPARECVTVIAQVIAHYANIEHMTLGYPYKGGFHLYSIKNICNWTGYSYKRVCEKLAIFEKSGLINIKERKEIAKNTNKWKSKDAIITITDKFFLSFGVTEETLLKHKFDANREKVKKLAPIKKYISKLIKNFDYKSKNSKRNDFKRKVEPHCTITQFHSVTNTPDDPSIRQFKITPTAEFYLSQIKSKFRKPPS